MSSHEAYLRNALTRYQYADIAKRDILNAFQSFKDLRPNLDTFVFNDGSRKELLSLEGTIPVSYKGNTYNIPVQLWLMESHPYNPPMVYVKPTSMMQIKRGKHVDANGKIYLPYLHEWKHPQSDLLGLIQVMTIVFGDEPPVFARQTGGVGGGVPARPPYPSNLPYPASGPGMPVPNTGFGNSGYQPATSFPNTGYQPPYSSYPQTSSFAQSSSFSSYTPYPSQASSVQQTTVSSSSNSMTLSDEQIRASIVSAVEDKMRRRLKEIFAQAQAEIGALQRTQEDLQKGKQTLEEMLERLEREHNDVEANTALLKEKIDEMQNALSKMENRETVEIDDVVAPTAPLYRQLLNVFAEEQATDDAIYYLGEGLRKNVIDLDVYLKQVRELSRRQFMLRALIQRCRQKAGLPEVA